VDIIATENGAVRLRGLDLQQRVRAMIDLAAPDYREALAREARELYGS
jgi:acyl-CoA hydrolase